nr:MAG TPA: hypothetical protein [Caudoviricetes sp.]
MFVKHIYPSMSIQNYVIHLFRITKFLIPY